MDVKGQIRSGDRVRRMFEMPNSVSMRQILGALGLATAIPLLILAVFIYQQMLANQRDAIRESLEGRAQTLAALLENELDTHLAVAGTLATSFLLESGDMSGFRRQAIKALKLLPGAWLSISSPSGVFLVSTLVEEGQPLPPRGRLDVMARAWATGKPQITDMAFGPVSQRQNTTIEYPIFKDGKPLYTIVMGLNPDRFHTLIKEKFPDGAAIGILDRNRKFVARVPDHEGRLGTPASPGWQAALAQSPRGWIENTTLEGVVSFTAYVPTRDGWTVGIAYPKAIIDAPILRVFWTTALAGVVLTLISLLLTLGIGRRLGRIMTDLTGMAQRLGEGQPVPLASFPLKEANIVAAAIHSSSEQLEAHHAVLAERENNLRVALDAAKLGWWHYDPFGKTAYWDERYRAILGITEASADFDRAMSLTHPDDRDSVIAGVHAALNPDNPQPYRLENRIVRPDGTTRWIEAHGSATFEEHEGVRRAVKLVGTVADITDRKVTEKRLKASSDTFQRLVENSPFGVYVVDADFRVSQMSAGARKALGNSIGRDFADVMASLWPEDVAADAVRRFRHTLETGEPYNAPPLVQRRRDLGTTEAYDWQIERLRLPNGRYGVVCHYYDLSERHRLEAELRESETRYRGTFENAAMGVANVALDGRWIEVNQRLCDIVGYTREELLAGTFQDITHPDDLEEDLDHVRALLAGDVESYTMDKRYIRKDGTIVWIGLTVSLLADDGAPRYFVSVIRDITERKALQNHQTFLLRELAHRSKNQLSIIQSMANQTARSSKTLDDFRTKFGERLRGLGVSTDLLVAQNWAETRVEDLVSAQLKPFNPGPGRLILDGVKVSVSADAAQAIGLALHELATNAVKYGAWSAPAGIVTITWLYALNGVTTPPLKLTWTESGGPTVTPPTRKGFGDVVIENMVAQKLGGEVVLEFKPEGLVWTLIVPRDHFSLLTSSLNEIASLRTLAAAAT